MTNHQIADMLREMALFLDMEGVDFKPRAYEKAATAVDRFDQPLAEVLASGGLKAVQAVPGVGKSIAEKVVEALTTGTIGALEEKRRSTPVQIMDLTRIEGVGAKSVRVLYHELGVRTLEDLAEAAREGRIRGLAHFGEKSEEKILKGLAFLQQSAGRLPIGRALPYLRPIEARLRDLPFVEQVVIAGSNRRFRETVKDADFLVVSSEPERVMDYFTKMPEVDRINAHGGTKAQVHLSLGMNADLRVVPAESFGAAMCYFTGSKAHNVHMRKIAIAQGYKLNEYGLFRKDDDACVAGATEEDIFEALGMEWIPPEIREDEGEIELAQNRALPRLIEPGDLKGDLQIQTTWTDGAASIEDMAEAARDLGFEYIAITDHTRDLAMVRGHDEEKLRDQMAYIRALKIKGIRVLCGAEVNIRKDGTLDIDDEVLAELDVVGAAIHHHFDLSRDEMTRRVIRAMENPHMDIYFHPTARKFGQRDAVALDMDAVIDAAKRTGTVLELDAHAGRLDLKDEHVRKAIAAGVPISIDSDAHAIGDLRYPRDLGVPTARRGWARKEDVLNTRPVDAFLAGLKDGRK